MLFSKHLLSTVLGAGHLVRVRCILVQLEWKGNGVREASRGGTTLVTVLRAVTLS